MLPPGAPISGFRLRSAATPHDENDEMRPPSAFGMEENRAVHVMVVGPAAMRPSSVAPSAARIATTGMVPPGAFAGTGATVGLMVPEVLLYRITAAAPAFCALMALL